MVPPPPLYETQKGSRKLWLSNLCMCLTLLEADSEEHIVFQGVPDKIVMNTTKCISKIQPVS